MVMLILNILYHLSLVGMNKLDSIEVLILIARNIQDVNGGLNFAYS
jgi:hypothetical protein